MNRMNKEVMFLNGRKKEQIQKFSRMEIKSRYKRSLLKRVSKIIFSIDSKVKRWTKKKKKGRQGRRKKADRPIRRRAHEARLQNTAASTIDSASRIFR